MYFMIQSKKIMEIMDLYLYMEIQEQEKLILWAYLI